MIDQPYETIELKHVTVNIYPDFDPINPRENDNLGTMAFYHRRYNLGDKLEFNDPNDLMQYLKDERAVYLPVFAYEHSGITISVGRGYPYNDPWDSGQLGVIYITREKIIKEYKWKRITRQRLQKIQGYLKAEVETYDDYLTGNVYGYQTICNHCGNDLDSCWGFYGTNWKTNGLMEYVVDKPDQCDNCKETAEVNNRMVEVCNV